MNPFWHCQVESLSGLRVSSSDFGKRIRPQTKTKHSTRGVGSEKKHPSPSFGASREDFENAKSKTLAIVQNNNNTIWSVCGQKNPERTVGPENVCVSLWNRRECVGMPSLSFCVIMRVSHQNSVCRFVESFLD